VVVQGVSKATAIATGSNHACAVVGGGAVRCWGYNGYGQLGNGTSTESHVATPVAGLTEVGLLTAGGYDTCAVMTGHTFCWGDNFYGEVGDASNNNHRLTPGAVVQLGLSSGIGIGTGHACARLTSGHLKCWGYNVFGQLGNGTTSDSTVPVPVSG
jgi:alpha-tubulin suppressor-like RCC1 family protein